jgi:hypothetical protein
VAYRYNLTRWLAAEAVYAYDRKTQHYFGTSGLSTAQANVHQATGGFVFRIPTSVRLRVSPYVLAEGGGLVLIQLEITSPQFTEHSIRPKEFSPTAVRTFHFEARSCAC